MAQRVITGVENDYLMCSICLGRYNDPRILPCGHTFCRQCLSDHIQQTVSGRSNRQFMCPIDRSPVPSPAQSRQPREWANTFPEDSFLASLLHAVHLHEDARAGGHIVVLPSRRRQPNRPAPSGSVNDPQNTTEEPPPPPRNLSEGLTCVEHAGRLLEFFCLGCNVLVCAHCAVRNHRAPRCECIAVDEAIDRLRPRVEALRQRFQNQMNHIEQISRGEIPVDMVLENSKPRVLQRLTEMETQLSRFTQICLQSVENLRQEIRESSASNTTGNPQLSLLFDAIQETKLTFDNVMQINSSPDLLSTLPRVESQADEYDAAMMAVSEYSTPSSEIEFLTNAAFNNFLRNPPPVGSINIKRAPRTHSQVQNTRVSQTTTNTRTNTRVGRDQNTRNRQGQTNRANQGQTSRVRREGTFNVTPANRTGAPVSQQTPIVRPTVTPRNPPRQMNPRRRKGPQKSKSTINVKNLQEDTMTWQLTGITFVGYSVVVVDSYNHMVRQCSIAGSPTMNKSFYIESPLGITSLTDPTEVAVTQPDKRKVVILTLDPDIRVKETIGTQKQYEAISQLNGIYFAVTCTEGRRCVDIIDRVGRIQKSIERSQLFRAPRYLTITSESSIVVSDREQKHVVCMTQTGQVQWTYPTPVSPWGVAADGTGNVYVCLDNNCVHVLSEDGSLIDDSFIAAKDGIRVPYAICARSRQVAITEFGSSLFAPNSPWVHVISA
ncbi:tripartite motif-containing protein 3-like [Mizuhopecten yessoensis]|uniref:Tripartite motif-containing protein 3 n=1 Tax=Mizuhopecten yessoensis TaxID=6573 RepID=A0A210PE78_MIZYE|nr:tripartite motif-containing protein 3-like [Mizuhopecten yessoensis]OWF34792.1 Tripartite motif-containing protein 3 [Mizuhopecten yessoensis]